MASRPLAKRLKPVTIKTRKATLLEQNNLQGVHHAVNELQKAGQAVYIRDTNGRKRRVHASEFITSPISPREWSPSGQSDDDDAVFEDDDFDIKPCFEDNDDDEKNPRTHVSTTLVKSKSSRGRQSVAMQKSNSIRSERHTDDEERSDRARSNTDDEEGCDKSDGDPSLSFRIGDTPRLDIAYREIFSRIQELSLKYILKDWIKELEPKKSRNHPYCGGPDAAPPWWPLLLGVDHREPDHLKKTPRHELARCLITYAMDPKFEGRGIDRLRHSTSNTKLKFDTDGKQADDKAKRRREMLEQLYDLMRLEYMYKQDEMDKNAQVSLRDATLRSVKAARVNKRGKQSRGKYTTRETVLDASQLADAPGPQRSRDAPLNYHRLRQPDHQMPLVPPPHIKNEHTDGCFDTACQNITNTQMSPRQDMHRTQSGRVPFHSTGPFPTHVSRMGPFGHHQNLIPQNITAFNMTQPQVQGFPTCTMPMDYRFDGNVDGTITTPALSMLSSSTASPPEQHLMQPTPDAAFTTPSSLYVPPSEYMDYMDALGRGLPLLNMAPYPQHIYQQPNHQHAAMPHFAENVPWSMDTSYDPDQKFPLTY